MKKVIISPNNWIQSFGIPTVLPNVFRDELLKKKLIVYKKGSTNGEMEFTGKYLKEAKIQFNRKLKL